MTRTERTTIFVKLLAIVGLAGLFCLFQWNVDRWDGINEAREYLRDDIKNGSPDKVKEWFRHGSNSEEGVSINDRLDDDRTWLMLATETGRPEIVKALLDVGADVNMQDRIGLTALKMATHKGNSDIVQMLQAAGAKE